MVSPRTLRGGAFVIVLLLAASLSVACGGDSADRPRPRVALGVAAQNRAEIQQREEETGHRMAGIRAFRRWDEPIFDSGMRWARSGGRELYLSIKSKRLNNAVIPWRDIANAEPGDPLYADMLSQSRQLKDFGASVYLIFNHEPEARPSRAMGTPADFVAAWRKLVKVHRKAGVRNVRYVWTVTAIAFSRNGGREAREFYPGDAYVDGIGVDAYNWYRCLSPTNPWMSLAELIEPHRLFGAAHPGKELMVLEWASAEDPQSPGRKAAWLRDAAELLQRPPYAAYTALIYWDGRHVPEASHIRCDLDYRSSASALSAWRQITDSAPYRFH
ncbi:glycosyl hydrolase [Actinomadura fulvescens]|uniref:GH26 domain-containing protein n=1 Tax=Actinomadura fulvescens TaxID=46160 RepID=A0ABP6CAA2_9ACTN